MKKTLLNFCLLVATVGGVLFACAKAQLEHALFGASLGAGGLLVWPALLLARNGMSQTWLMLAGTALVVLALIAWGLRTRSLVRAPVLGCALSIAYCLLGAQVLRQLSIPAPMLTPYEADATQRQEYLDAYQAGYRAGFAGLFRTYCFAPQHRTRGYGEGSASGFKVYLRCLGVRYPRALTNSPAVRDGAIPKAKVADGEAATSSPASEVAQKTRHNAP